MTIAPIAGTGKNEQSNWSLILDGVAGLTDSNPHVTSVATSQTRENT